MGTTSWPLNFLVFLCESPQLPQNNKSSHCKHIIVAKHSSASSGQSLQIIFNVDSDNESESMAEERLRNGADGKGDEIGGGGLIVHVSKRLCITKLVFNESTPS